jgi:hypothetical protein
MRKLYVVVDSALKSGLKIAQACHAMRSFAAKYPELELDWYQNSNNIVVLEHPDVLSLSDFLQSKGFKVARFHEPDQDGAMTGFAAEPRAWKLLSNIRLAA